MDDEHNGDNAPVRRHKRSLLVRRTLLKGAAAGLAAGTLANSGLARTALANDFADDKGRKIDGRRILLRGGTILSMDPDVGNAIKADLLIDGKKIAGIGPGLSSRGATVIDAHGTILVPGFVETHRHCWQNTFRRAIPNARLLSDYAALTHRGVGLFSRPQDHYAGSLISGLSAMHCGITSMLDFSHNSRTAAHVDAAIKAHLDSGLRAVFAYGPASFGTWDRQWPQDIVRVKNKFFRSEDQLVSLRLATPLDAENFALARSAGVKITSDFPTNVNLILDLARQGVLGPDVTFIHCTALPDSVFQAMKDHGVRLALAPTSDAHYRGLGDSVAPVQKGLDFNIPMGLSVDAEVSLSPDMFSQMRQTFYTQRMLANQRFAAGDTNAPVEMSPRQILEMATLGGAMCNGLESRVGSLAPGKEADILMVEADDILNMPLNNAYGTVVLGADNGSIRNVFIAGRLVKWNGRLVGVDIDAVRKLVYASRDYLAAQTQLWKPDYIVDGAM